jgi:hypothetical protein
MKPVALVLLLVPLSGLMAQHSHGSAGIRPEQPPPNVVPTLGALGGNYGSAGRSRPLGGVAPPTFPIGVPKQHKPQQPASGYRYFGPIYYVPNMSEYDFSSAPASNSTFNTPATPYAPAAPAAPAAPQTPIIINQYFNSRDGATTTTSGAAPPARNDDNPEQKYYLIAYKDHSVYTALTYWIEGDILHYVTTRNTHNQASLSLIDIDQTTKLNADNPEPFSLTPTPK